MFCSEICKTEAFKIYHRHEINLRAMEFTQRILLESLAICDGSFEKLDEIMNSGTLMSKTVFDFNWNDAKCSNTDHWKLISFTSLQEGPDSNEFDWIETHSILGEFSSSKEKNIARRFLKKTARILSVNCYSLDYLTPEIESTNCRANKFPTKMKVGSGLFLLGSLFNHSCAPNIERILVDNKFVFFARRPIRKGEQLFISYG